MKAKSDTKIRVGLNKEAVSAIEDVKNYLEIEKGVKAEYSDIIVAGLKMAQRMGPGRYGIYWEMQEEKKRKEEMNMSE